jgi:uncharacterized protein YceK
VTGDARFAGEPVAGAAQGKGETIGFQPLGLVLMTLDLPVSLVGDTLTLPWTLTRSPGDPMVTPEPLPSR